MTSLRMRAVAVILRLTRKPGTATVKRAHRRIAARKRPSAPPAALRRRHSVTSRQVEGFPCHTVTPKGRPAGRGAVYIHGGSYINGIAPQHWTLVSRLADAGVRVDVPDYGLAPRHTYREAYPFLTAVYRRLVEEMDPATITIAGDSAGAGLALGFAQTLAEHGLPQPRGLVLISPWLDLTLADPAVAAAEARDPWLTRVGLVEAGRAWAGGDDPTAPRLSPMNGPLTGIAPTQVYVGTRDLLYPDVLRFQRRAAAEGLQVELTVRDGAVHVYPLVPVPEGRAASRVIVRDVSS